jgi:two-component system, OmpR family, sensor kinase
MLSADSGSERRGQLLTVLVQLLRIHATELQPALDEATRLIAHVLGADTADVFLYDAAAESLVVTGMPDSPLGVQQRATGLDQLLLADGGLTVQVFQHGGSYRTGHRDQETNERQDVVANLQLRSVILCRIDSDGVARGVLQVAARQRDWFSPTDLRFLQAVACGAGARQQGDRARPEHRREDGEDARQQHSGEAGAAESYPGRAARGTHRPSAPRRARPGRRRRR